MVSRLNKKKRVFLFIFIFTKCWIPKMSIFFLIRIFYEMFQGTKQTTSVPLCIMVQKLVPEICFFFNFKQCFCKCHKTEKKNIIFEAESNLQSSYPFLEYVFYFFSFFLPFFLKNIFEWLRNVPNSKSSNQT